MLQGTNFIDLAQKLVNIEEQKRDLIVPTSMLNLNSNAELEIVNGKTTAFSPTNWAHQQLASYVDIPKAYYDRLKVENKALLSDNVNHGFRKYSTQAAKENKSESRFVRTIGNEVRAVLSQRFRALDNTDMLTTVMPLMADMKMNVISSEVTEKRLYIKAVSKALETEVKRGDVVQYGLVISNSEVGAGSVRIEPMIYRLVCLNGMISPDSAIRKYHIGKDLAGVDIQEILSDETKALNDKAFWASVHDVVKNSMQREVFETIVDRLRVAANEPIKNIKLDRVVELTTKHLGVSGEKTKAQILMELVQGGDLSRWGLVNAITKTAHTLEGIDYDTATDLERAGGKVLDLTSDQWRTISATA